MARLMVVLLVVGGVACSQEDTQVCTLIGCGPQLEIRLPSDIRTLPAFHLQVCVDGDCSTGSSVSGELGVSDDGRLLIPPDAAPMMALADRDWSGAHAVTVEVSNDSGMVLARAVEQVEFEMLFPNGPNCPPPCWHGTVSL